MIDWTNPTCPISWHFTVREAIWLPSWNRLAKEDDGLNDDAKEALVLLFTRLDYVRDEIGLPIYVHCAFRPPGYNAIVGGKKHSRHMARREGGLLLAAADWSCDIEGQATGKACDEIRAEIDSQLPRFQLSMEKNPGAPWIHLDTMKFADGYRAYEP